MRILNNAAPSDLMQAASIQQIFAGMSVVAAVSAQSSQSQLILSSGNGFAHVLGLWVSLATAGDVVIGNFDTNLATDDGVGHSTTGPMQNSFSHVRHATSAALQGTLMKRLSLPAAQSVNLVLPYEWATAPTHGVIVQAVTVNVAMTVSWVWFESLG